jgi:cytochrome c
MKAVVLAMYMAAGLLSAAPAWAASMPELAKKNRCNDCHAIDKKIIGPAWMDVSKKYQGDAEAEARLVQKVSKGGSGVWGDMPMPANDPGGRKLEDIKGLVQFILGLAKGLGN